MKQSRITFEDGKRSGQACIRGLRITVADIISYKASGMTDEQILSDFPELEQADIDAAVEYTNKRITQSGEVVTLTGRTRNLGHGQQSEVVYQDDSTGWEHTTDLTE